MMVHGPNMIGKHGVLNPLSKPHLIVPMKGVVAIEGVTICRILMTLFARDDAKILYTLVVKDASLPTSSSMGNFQPS